MPSLSALPLAPIAIALLLSSAGAPDAQASTSTKDSSIHRTPGFSTGPGECLATVRETLQADRSRFEVLDQGTRAAYLAHEAAANLALRGRRRTPLHENKEGAAGAPSSTPGSDSAAPGGTSNSDQR